MKKPSHSLLASCLLLFGFMPSDAFASYALSMANAFKGALAGSSTYYFNSGNTVPVFSPPDQSTSLVIPASGTLKAIYGNIFTRSTASDEACIINIIKNGESSTLVTDTYTIAASGYNPFGNDALNLPVAAGDVLQVELKTPAWTKAPYSPSFSLSLYIE